MGVVRTQRDALRRACIALIAAGLVATPALGLAQAEQDVLKWIKLIPDAKKKPDKPAPGATPASTPNATATTPPMKPTDAPAKSVMASARAKPTPDASTAAPARAAVANPANAARADTSGAAARIADPAARSTDRASDVTETAMATPSGVVPVVADTPTAPDDVTLKMLYSELPQLPKRAVRLGIAGGTVVATFTIRADGSVADVKLTSAKPSELKDPSIVATIEKWRFAPIREDQQASIELVFKP